MDVGPPVIHRILLHVVPLMEQQEVQAGFCGSLYGNAQPVLSQFAVLTQLPGAGIQQGNPIDTVQGDRINPHTHR